MSKINLNNYEAFMLDYLEGNLSAGDIKALKLFAALHPELELNFDDELVKLENESVSFAGKENLKAGFSDELVIGYLENVLDGAEKKQAEELAASNAVFKHELELYKKTIAVADTSIVFGDKEKLKRRGTIIFLPQNNYIRVAAALLLLLGLWFMVSRVMKDDSAKIAPELANKTNEEKKVIRNNVAPQNVSEEPKVVENSNTFIAKKTNKPLNTNTVVSEQEINTSTISANVPDDKIEPQLTDNKKDKEQPLIVVDSNATQLANANSEKLGPKYIIEEGADDEQVAAKPKGKLWNLASGLFKGLNRRGVENINSSENTNEIFIGALTISKPN